MSAHSQRLRVGLVSYDYRPAIGGQGVYVSELVARLQQSNVDAEVICARSTDSTAVPIGGANSLDYSLRLARRLNSICRDRNYDLLHVQGGPGGAVLLRKPKLPFVYTAHHTYYQQRTLIPNPKWKSLPYRLLERLEARAYRWATRVVSVSSTTEAVLQNIYQVPPGRLSIVPNGVDVQRFRNATAESDSTPSILFVGRLHERKGIGYLIQAVATLTTRIPDVKLYIIGRGPEREALEDMAKSLNIESSVIFLGHVDDADLPGWYKRVSVFVLPSLFEGFGIVCLEAMASTTPVIGTRVPGIIDIIDDGVTGLCVEPMNSQALSDAILMLLQSHETANRLAKCALSTVEEKFDWHSVAQQLAVTYRSALRCHSEQTV